MLLDQQFSLSPDFAGQGSLTALLNSSKMPLQSQRHQERVLTGINFDFDSALRQGCFLNFCIIDVAFGGDFTINLNDRRSPLRDGLAPQHLRGAMMKSMTNRKMIQLGAGFLALALCISVFSAPALAQPPRRSGPPGGRPYGPPPPPPPRRGPNDLDRALAIVGTVGAVAAIASARNNSYYYNRQYYPYRSPYSYRPPTVVVRSPPSPIVVERQVVVEKPVVIERQVPVVIDSSGSYSHKLGASFRIENMQIPGYRFTAARLTSDPLPDSPLYGVGLRKGDVITRLNDSPADTLAELERHERNTLIRYIKTGTTKVLLANVYIPTETEVRGNETYYAP
jgi:hypothetical protein